MSARPNAPKRLGSPPPGPVPPQRQPRLPRQRSQAWLISSHATPSLGSPREGDSQVRTLHAARNNAPNRVARPTVTPIQDYNPYIHPDPPSPARRSGWSRIGVSTPSSEVGTADAGPT